MLDSEHIGYRSFEDTYEHLPAKDKEHVTKGLMVLLRYLPDFLRSNLLYTPEGEEKTYGFHLDNMANFLEQPSVEVKGLGEVRRNALLAAVNAAREKFFGNSNE